MIPAATAAARIVSPLSVSTPTARPFSTMTRRTRVESLMSTPWADGGFRHGLGDRAHAADSVAPDAFLAVHLAEAVVQENIGRARRVGARIIADDAVEAEGGLDRRALEPAVEKITGGGGEKIEKFPLQIESEGANSVAHPADLDQFGDRRERGSLDNVRRRLEDDGAQHIGDRRQACLIIVQTIRIPRREFRDLSFRLAAADLQEASVIQWQKVGDRTLDDAQAMDGKIEVADDLRVQQRDGVGCDRIGKAGLNSSVTAAPPTTGR